MQEQLGVVALRMGQDNHHFQIRSGARDLAAQLLLVVLAGHVR